MLSNHKGEDNVQKDNLIQASSSEAILIQECVDVCVEALARVNHTSAN